MNFVKKLCVIVPHAVIILSLVFLAFIVLDWYNPLMGFLATPSSTALLTVLCALSIVNSIRCIIIARIRAAEGHRPREHTRRK